jgi:hypothetical protein
VVITCAGSLVIARLLGMLKVRDVPDVGDGSPRGARAATIDFIVLVVKNQEFLPLLVENPPLVSVGRSFVGGD